MAGLPPKDNPRPSAGGQVALKGGPGTAGPGADDSLPLPAVAEGLPPGRRAGRPPEVVADGGGDEADAAVAQQGQDAARPGRLGPGRVAGRPVPGQGQRLELGGGADG